MTNLQDFILAKSVDFVPSSKVASTPDSLYIPSANPKNSEQDFESWPKIKNRHQTIESDTGLQLLPFLFDFFW